MIWTLFCPGSWKAFSIPTAAKPNWLPRFSWAMVTSFQCFFILRSKQLFSAGDGAGTEFLSNTAQVLKWNCSFGRFACLCCFGGLFFCLCLIFVHTNILLHLGLLSKKINHKALVWRGLAWINQAAGPGTSRMSLCASNNPKPQQLPPGLSQERSSPSLEGVAADVLQLLKVWWAGRIKLLLKGELRSGEREQIIQRGDWVWVISVHIFCI